MTRGRCGSLALQRATLSFTTLRRFSPALSERPIAVTYQITEFGRSALGILDKLQEWTEKHGV